MLFYRARYYDPRIGRFTQEDEHGWYGPGTGRYASPDPEGLVTSLPPSRFAGLWPVITPYPMQVGQLNLLYGYVAGRPLEFSDASGGGILKYLKPIKCIWYSKRCLDEAFKCNDMYRRCFNELAANEDYDKINEMFARAGVADYSSFIYKQCFQEEENCQMVATLGCPHIAFKPF